MDASLAGIPGDFNFYLYSTNSSYNYSALEAALRDGKILGETSAAA